MELINSTAGHFGYPNTDSEDTDNPLVVTVTAETAGDIQELIRTTKVHHNQDCLCIPCRPSLHVSNIIHAFTHGP